MRKIAALVHTWLVLDFFGDARRTGGTGSSLTTTIFTQSFLAAVFAFLLYPETPMVPFAAANLSLSSLLVAIGTLANEDQLNRRRADHALLASAPVGRATVTLARSGHAAFYVCALTIGMALPPAVLLSFLQENWWCPPAYVGLACACSGLATGALAVTMRFFVRVFGTAGAALLAGSAKAMLLGSGLTLFALGMQRLQQTADALPIGRAGAEMLPPYHAARLLHAPAEEAWRILPFLAGAVLLLAIGIAIGDTESRRRTHVRGHGLLLRVLARLAPRGPSRGIAEFVASSMWRSPSFRSRVLPLLGLPAGMVFLSLQSADRGGGYVFTCLLLQLPAIYLPFLIAFLPRADQTDAGWIFDQAPTLTRKIVQDATWRALVSHVLVPVHALALALLLCTNPSLDTVAASLFALGVGVTASRGMVRSVDRVPFSRDREGDAGTDLGGLFGAALVLGGLGTAFGGVLPTLARWPLAVAAIALAGFLLRRRGGGDAATPDGAAAAWTASPSDEPEVAQEPLDPASGSWSPEASLRRELMAIGVLYAAVCLIPALFGTMFAA